MNYKTKERAIEVAQWMNKDASRSGYNRFFGIAYPVQNEHGVFTVVRSSTTIQYWLLAHPDRKLLVAGQ